ncbi:hypothetical protein C5G87_05620 [Paenibacillus peoriae]|nr:hypothetical protein C5G87_05620 [Paenibacillus peoriae]
MAVDRIPRFNAMKSLLQMSEVRPPNEERLFFYGEKIDRSIENVTFIIEFRSFSSNRHRNDTALTRCSHFRFYFI